MIDDLVNQLFGPHSHERGGGHAHGRGLEAAGPDKEKTWVERILEERSGEGGGDDALRERLRSLLDDQRQQQREGNDRGGRER